MANGTNGNSQPSLFSKLVHLGGNVLAPIAKADASIINAVTPGAPAQQLYNAGAAVNDPNRVLSQPSQLGGGGQSGWTQVLGSNTANNPTGTPGNVTDPSASGQFTQDQAVANQTAANNSYYDQLTGNVNHQLDSLDQQQAVGEGNVNNAYTDAFSKLTASKGLAERNYKTSKDQLGQDFVGAKNTIGTQVGQQQNNLARLLGAHGAGSDYNIGYARQLAAQQGGQNINNALQTFGKNSQALDTNWGDYTNNFDNSVKDLGVQKQNNLNSLLANVASNRQTLLQKLNDIAVQRGQAPNQALSDQINGLGDQITQLGAKQFAFTPQDATYKAPTLDQYVNPGLKTAQVANQNAVSDTASPYLATLLGQQKDKTQNLVPTY